MERILIIGNAGAGKSTLARLLADKTKLPLIHLDRLYWCGHWQHRSREEFDRLLQGELERPRWIIDGNFTRTIPKRLEYADTVIFLDLPTLTCLWGITKRLLQNYGKTRQDMGGNCPEKWDKNKISLYRGVLTFRKQRRKNLLALLENKKGIQVLHFKSRKQAKKWLENFTESFSTTP